ncbi:hypothetical protein N4363_003452 [Escherichia coli]
MTVSTEVDHNEYTGNGVTTSFPYTFRIFKKSDLTVQVADLNENITVLTLDTDYSVTGAGTYSGGNVVLMSPLANGWQISISRDLPVTQDTDLRNQGKFFAEVHEDAFDKLTMLIQQCFSFLRLALRKPSFIANYYDALNNRIRNLRDPSQAQDAATKGYADNLYHGAISHSDNNFKRTLRVPESEVGMLPGISGRRKKILAFNDTGNPIAVLPESGSAADVLIQLASSELPGSSLVALRQGGTLHDAIRWVSPRMMAGCPTDGETDAGIYLQRAINKAKELNLPLNIDGVFKSSIALDWPSDNPIKIFGFIPETCRIEFTNAAAYGLTVTQNSAYHFIDIAGVSITSGAEIIAPKALLTVDASPQVTTDMSAGKYLLGDRTIRRGKIHNIDVDVATDCYFVNGVQFKSWMNYSIDTVLVRGSRLNLTSATNGFLLSGDGYPVDIHMTNLWMYNLGRAINSVDYIEGLHVSHFEFVNVLRGVSGAYDASYSTLAESLCAIYSPFLSAGHVNLGTFTGADVCLYLKNVTTPNLSHMFLFASAGADVTSANGVKLINCIGGSVRDVTVAGSGAANTKTNNFSICLDSCKRVVVSGCRGTFAGAAIRLQGGSVNNILSDNTGESCVNTVFVESTADYLNKITSSNRGVSLTGPVVGGVPSANDMEPVIYHRTFSLTFSASQAVGSTLTFNIPLVTGTFGVAPDAAGLELPSGLYAIASYDKSNSTASSARMTLYFLVAATAGTYSLSFRASALATSRTQ